MNSQFSFPVPNLSPAQKMEVADPDGTVADLGDNAAIRVNGTIALTNNEFADWEAGVSLSPGDNTVIVQSEDRSGNLTEVATIPIESKPQVPLSTPHGVTLDEANSRALVVDSQLGLLVAIDLATGNRALVSSSSRGSGPMPR